MKRALIIVVVAVAPLITVLAVRAVSTGDPPAMPSPAAPVQLDTLQIAQHLSQAIRIATINDGSPIEGRSAPFVQLRGFLETTYPLVHARLQPELIAGYSLLYKWTGSDPTLDPILLMGHLDVVPADSLSLDRWTQPPFSGAIVNAEVWGRGALDDKQHVIALHEAVEQLLRDGFAPARTVYLFFGHDEEAMDTGGAQQAAELLRARGVKLQFVLDEGGVIVQGMVPGVTRPVALVRTAEKGFLTLELSVAGRGGHSSTPSRPTTVGILARAISRVEANPFPSRLDGATRDLLTTVSAQQPFGLRLVTRNLWLFRPVVTWMLTREPASDATVRTTIAPTMLQASPKANVLPTAARATVNLRLLPGDEVEEVVAHVRRAIDDERVEVQVLTGVEASPASPLNSTSYALLRKSILEVAPEVVVAPFLLTGGTDARHFTALSQNVYGFSAARGGPELVERAHGINERIAIADLVTGIRIYLQVIRNAQAR